MAHEVFAGCRDYEFLNGVYCGWKNRSVAVKKEDYFMKFKTVQSSSLAKFPFTNVCTNFNIFCKLSLAKMDRV
jgi:hypothetical protein